MDQRPVDSSVYSVLRLTDVIPSFKKVVTMILGIIMLVTGGLSLVFSIVIISSDEDYIPASFTYGAFALQQLVFPYLVCPTFHDDTASQKNYTYFYPNVAIAIPSVCRPSSVVCNVHT